MTRPNLDTEEGYKAYRAELKQVGKPLRWAGLLLIVAAAALIMAIRYQWAPIPADMSMVGYAGLACGWALMLAATFQRTRYHRRRMAENA